jgi:ADP-ribose pyrophosphatase YjhB (NUDIX family)
VLENYGGVLVSGGGRFLLREPAGHFGGLAWTFAKTQAKDGESPELTALRAVKEKTGYEARIRDRLSGAFGGASGPATWFLMEARHPPEPPNWQTKSIRWARYDEAVDMIQLSANIQARRRDLAILEAARALVENVPFVEHLIVHPVDWPDLKPMPRQHAVLYPELAFDAQAMERIGRGFVMHDMDAKWFIYLDGDRLKLHRSWTGILVFDAGFAFDAGGGARVSDLVVTRDPAQYNTSSDAEDLELFMNVMRWNLLEPPDWK